MDDRERRFQGDAGDASRPSLWRPDEGHASAPETSEPVREVASIWRPDEGAPPRAVTELRPSSEPVDLWAPRQPEKTDEPEETIALDDSPPPRSSRGPKHRKPPRKRRWARNLALVTLLLALVAIAADGVLVGIGLRDDLTAAKSALSEARGLVADGDLDAGRARLESARDAIGHASSLTERPSFLFASSIPAVDDETATIEALIEAGLQSIDGGLEGLAALGVLDVGSEGVAAELYREGRVDLDAIASLRPHLERARSHLAAGRVSLSGDVDSRVPAVDEAVSATRREINELHGTVARGERFLGLLPALLGQGGERRYLLAFQALGEARGTGGLFGTFGIVSASEGETELESVSPIGEMIPTPRVEGPEWFERAYGSFAALRQPQQVNLTPHFPTAAEIFLRMYEAESGETADGVIALDPVALGHMLEGTGPIQARGLDTIVTSDNAAGVLLHDSYAEIEDSDAQNVYIARLVRKFWGKIQEGEFDEVAFARGVGEAVRTGHFKIYSRSGTEQDDLVALDAADDFISLGPNVQLAFLNNYGVNKLDYFLERDIDTQIEVANDGSLAVATDITLRNTTPADVDPGLLGPNPRTTNTAQVAVLVPQEATDLTWTVDGDTRSEFTYRDNEHPVVWDIVRIRAGHQATIRLTYTMPAEGSGDLDFTMVPQTAVTPAGYSLQIVPPSGYDIQAEPSGRVEVVELDGTLDEERTVRFSVVEKR